MYMDDLPYIWLALMVVLAICEGLTTQLVSIWFVIGAFAAAIVSFFVPNLTVQIALFVGVSLFMLLITKPFVKKIRQTKAEPTNADMNIGKTAVVIQQINNTEATGQVKLAGNVWTARTVNGEIVEKGQKVIVQEISGVKLMVTPLAQK